MDINLELEGVEGCCKVTSLRGTFSSKTRVLAAPGNAEFPFWDS